MKTVGRRPKIYICGAGQTGSTWMARMFKEAGWDLGPEDELDVADGGRKGLEWIPFKRLCIDMVHGVLGARKTPKGRTEHIIFWNWYAEERRWELVRRYKSEVEALSFPEVIKMGDEHGQHALMPWIRPGHTILTLRSVERVMEISGDGKAARSGGRQAYYRGLFMGIGIFVESLVAARLPFTILEWPRAGEDPEYAYRVLRPVMKMNRPGFMDLWERVTRPEWVDYERKAMSHI